GQRLSNMRERPGAVREDAEVRDLDELEEALEAAAQNTWLDGDQGLWKPWPPIPSSLWLQILSVAKRIRELAITAHHAGARLRWFDFDRAQGLKQARGGLPGRLEPVNS